MVYHWGETERGVDKRPNQIFRGQAAAGMAKGDPLLENARTIKGHAVRPFLTREQLHDVDKVSVAFLARAPHKFADQILSDSVDVRRDTLATMSRWLLAHPKNKEAQVAANAVSPLTALISDKDSTVRERATQVLSQLVTVHSGVNSMLAAGTVPHLIVAMKDADSEATRKNAHACLQHIAAYPEGAQAVVSSSGTAELVAVCDETPSPEALLSLACCLRNPDGLQEAILVGASKAMVRLLSHESAAVAQCACKNLALLTTPIEAKAEAIACGAVPPLVALLRHELWPVRSAAACALMSVTVDIEGKRRAFDGGAVPTLIGLLRDPNEPVAMFAVRCLGNMAEYRRDVMSTPMDGYYKATFDGALPALRLLMASSNRTLAKSARDTADLIQYRP